MVESEIGQTSGQAVNPKNQNHLASELIERQFSLRRLKIKVRRFWGSAKRVPEKKRNGQIRPRSI